MSAEDDLINLGVCIKQQAERVGVEHEGVPLEGVVVRIANAASEAATAAEVFRDMGIKHKAERDAALAAIERVKETLSLHNPNGRLVKEVLAALDGAPEPEWEWGVRDADCGTTYVVARPKDSAISSGRYLRRRKAGPWEPVERERSHEQTT